mmetsp:Transcript_28962/g.59335  ORF Transcript_28962/g.59335 Transcript_28962/m.59335 type:complete len:210 (-) Transcript_28962:2859-3488(-)
MWLVHAVLWVCPVQPALLLTIPQLVPDVRKVRVPIIGMDIFPHEFVPITLQVLLVEKEPPVRATEIDVENLLAEAVVLRIGVRDREHRRFERMIGRRHESQRKVLKRFYLRRPVCFGPVIDSRNADRGRNPAALDIPEQSTRVPHVAGLDREGVHAVRLNVKCQRISFFNRDPKEPVIMQVGLVPQLPNRTVDVHHWPKHLELLRSARG